MTERGLPPGGRGDRLLDATELAALLNVPVTWVRESTRSGAIPHIKLGRYRRYREADVMAWLDACSSPGKQISLRKGQAG